MNQDFVLECILQCEAHYIPPNKDYITCKDFGNPDGMNGGCHWCLEMTPYQWHMCHDESWLKGLIKNPKFPKGRPVIKYDRETGAAFIEGYKQDSMKAKVLIE